MKMEFQKIVNFLDTSFDDKDLPRFVNKKWIQVYDQSERNYGVNKEIRIKTSMLRFDFTIYVIILTHILLRKKLLRQVLQKILIILVMVKKRMM